MNQAFGAGDLLHRAGAGDQEAWDALVSRHTPMLWSVARSHRLGAADAADAVQTTWLRLLEHIHRIHDPDRLGGWLATTVKRECLRILRREGRERPVDDPSTNVADDSDPVDTRLLTDERDRVLWRAFLRLPERCQFVLRAFFLSPSELSYGEVAERLSIPIGSLGPTRRRCLARLQALLDGAGLFPTSRESSEGPS